MAASVALVSGCVSSHDCTEIGCLSGVEVEFPSKFEVGLLPLVVTTCADDVCTVERVEPGYEAPGDATIGVLGLVSLSESVERSVNVTVYIRSEATGETVVDAEGVGRLRRAEPNGPDCPPVCYGLAMKYDEAARELVQT